MTQMWEVIDLILFLQYFSKAAFEFRSSSQSLMCMTQFFIHKKVYFRIFCNDGGTKGLSTSMHDIYNQYHEDSEVYNQKWHIPNHQISTFVLYNRGWQTTARLTI